MEPPSRLPRPPTAYWWCQVTGWGAYFLVNVLTSQGFLSFSWRLVSGYAVLSLLGVLFTHGFRSFILRRGWLDLPVARLLPRLALADLVLAVLLVALVTIYFLLVPPAVHSFAPRNRTALFATGFVFVFNDFIIFLLWSGFYFGYANFQRQGRMEIERYQAQTALAEAELRGLKSQLNPHFLFNSLNSLRALVLEDPPRAQDAVTQLAAILRYHLQSGERSLVPLSEELATVEQYLALELIRFDDRLTIERAIEPETLPFLVPPLALQTLVENAVKYGVSRDAGEAVILLAVEKNGEGLELSVRNTGAIRGEPTNGSTTLGLANLRTRLRLLFAERATLKLHEPEPGWVEARLVLPATRA